MEPGLGGWRRKAGWKPALRGGGFAALYHYKSASTRTARISQGEGGLAGLGGWRRKAGWKPALRGCVLFYTFGNV